MSQTTIRFLVSRFLGISILFTCVGCEGQYESLVRKADQEALEQKSQLAKYLYFQVVRDHKAKDEIRYRALKGLGDISLTQLYDYPTAMAAYDKIFEEFGQVSRYQTEIYDLRLKAATCWRVNLERPQKALDVLTPLISSRDFKISFGRELGKIYLSLRNYEQAQHWFIQTYEAAKKNNDCAAMRSSQLDVVQTFSLQKKCDEVLHWSNINFSDSCQPDRFSLAVEKANCFEINGQVDRALSLYKNLIKEDPENTRINFFLENLKRRQKEKQKK